MPFRRGIVVAGEDFVGEEAALGAQMRRRLPKRPQILAHFDSEDDLFAREREINREIAGEKAKQNSLRAYLAYWRNKKVDEVQRHVQKGCYAPCSQCLFCSCQRMFLSQFRCRCSEGKKYISAWRIAFLNSAEKAFQTRHVWEVGVGYVPRQESVGKQRLDWRDMPELN